MRIGVIGSMQYTDKMIELVDQLNSLGHEAFLTDLHKSMVGKSWQQIEEIKIHQKNNMDAIREFWNAMQGADAVLVANYEKHGIPNYIGGNTFLEIGFAHVLGQKIFMMNPIPEMIYTTELVAMKPLVLGGDLSKINNELIASM